MLFSTLAFIFFHYTSIMYASEGLCSPSNPVEGAYNDDYDASLLLEAGTVGATAKKAMTEKDRISTNEGSKTPLMDSAGHNWDVHSIRNTSKTGAEDALLALMEMTHHKKRIPVSKMPPYLINNSSDTGLKPASCNGMIVLTNVSSPYDTRPGRMSRCWMGFPYVSKAEILLLSLGGEGMASIVLMLGDI